MAKLSENQKLGVVVGVAVLLTGLGGAGVWWAKDLVQEKVDSITLMKTEIDAAQAKIQKIPAVEQDVIILRENLYEYIKILPEESELNEFARVANQFRSQSGVVMTRYLPGRTSSTGRSSPFQSHTYKIELRATVWQFMEFMSLFEGYERFVQIKDFTLNSGASKRGAAMAQEVLHSISLTVETYVYRSSAKSKDVAIANYANKVEKLREEIFEARQTIARPGFKFEGDRGRRDIFVDPRESSGTRKGGFGGPSPRDQRKIIDDISADLDECQKIFRRLQDPNITIFDRYTLQRRLREDLATLEREVEDINTKALISHVPLKLAWNREVIEPLSELNKSVSSAAETQQRDRWLAEAQMSELLIRMKDDLAIGDIEGAIDRYDMVEERLRVSQEDERYPIYARIEGLYLRAKLANEFSSLDLEISGILVNDGGRSGIIVNGTVFEEGEYVDNNLLVKSVGREQVEFVYKGFTVVRTL